MYAIVPVKSFHDAKLRLASVLERRERSELSRAMLQDVLCALRDARCFEKVLVCATEPSVKELAEEFGAELVLERTLGCSGLNPSLQALGHQLAASTEALLVVHGDLPALQADECRQIALALSEHDLVIAPDRHQQGSNILGWQTRCDFHPQFGADSYSLHRAAGQVREMRQWHAPSGGASWDIDHPEDLPALFARPQLRVGVNTRAYLESTDVLQRCRKRTVTTLATTPTVSTPPSAAAIEDDSLPTDEQALALAEQPLTPELLQQAARLRDAHYGKLISYSRKVFIPLTHLCRDVCHYCTFAKTPRHLDRAYMSADEAVAIARRGASLGCREALLTLGEKPELRYRAARDALQEMGFASTLEYVAHVAGRILRETGVLPHINAGNMDESEIALLRPVSASMGLMLESAAARLSDKGMPHHGSPDKDPEARLRTIALAGEAKVPFTSGILIGIGETRRERVESLLALRRLHQRYGHLQEIIIQNFRAKPGTRMADAPEPDLDELRWTIAIARLLFGASLSIQVPPNLSPGMLPKLVGAGISDWGGVSPLTPDYVNPEAPWPQLEALASQTHAAGKTLVERLTIYPAYTQRPQTWLDPALRPAVLAQQDGQGFARGDLWCAGSSLALPWEARQWLDLKAPSASAAIAQIVTRAQAGERLGEADIATLFEARGEDFSYICRQADALRHTLHGGRVSYVVNRNINYSNICYFKCGFCAFSKGRGHSDLRGPAYDLADNEITRRVGEAWDRGATEVCLQGGIHPDYSGQKYLNLLDLIRAAQPGIHIHAFSPLEVWQGAQTLGISLREFLKQLKARGLATLPGTAAEVLDDDVRAHLCPDKINTAQWLEVMRSAHQVGLRSTATIMYGHVDSYLSWAKHLLAVRDLQAETGGFTEFVPLPFVAGEAPIYRKGLARKGPTFREALLMHAVARLVLHPLIANIQASWVKMGPAGMAACLNAGANDLGGTLMNESITRAAGAEYGQEFSPQRFEALIRDCGREPWQRTTLYQAAPPERQNAAYAAQPLEENPATPPSAKASRRIAATPV